MNKNKEKNISEWGYKEDNKKLSARIDAHDKFSEKNIDDWMLRLVGISGSEKILDIGCGAGKQILAFGKKLISGGEIIGSDISDELISKAQKVAKENKINASFLIHDMDRPFPFKDGEFDFICASFSIYYSKNPKKLIIEIKRLLKNKGKLFISGPTPNNTKDFWNLHAKTTARKIPEICLKRIARIRDIYIPLIKKNFRNIKINIFKNNIHFPNTEKVMEYYSSSLLLEESARNKKEKEEFLEKMEKEVRKIIKNKNVLVLKKEVYGILAYK